MNRYKCEKKNFFLRKKFFRGGAGSPCQKKIFPAFGRKNFFWDTPGYTWIHLAIARCCRIHLKGLKSVPGYGFWAQVYPEVFRWGVIAKKNFQGGGAGLPFQKKKFSCLRSENFFLDTPWYTWQLPGVAGYTWKAWKVSQIGDFGPRCIQKFSGGWLRKKNFMGGMDNPVITQPARMKLSVIM